MADLGNFGGNNNWERLKNLAQTAVNLAAQNPQPQSIYGSDAYNPPPPPPVETGPYADMLAMQAAGEQDYLSNTAPISYNPPPPPPAPMGFQPNVEVQGQATAVADNTNPYPMPAAEMPVQNTPQPGGFWNDLRNYFQPEGPSPATQAFSSGPGVLQDVKGAAGDAVGGIGSLYDQYLAAVGGPTPTIGGSAEQVGRSLAEGSVPTTWGELALTPLFGLTPFDDALKGAVKGGVRSYIDDAARLGTDFIPEGAAARTIAPPATVPAPAFGPAVEFSPTEGLRVPPVAGGAPTPEEIVRRQVEELTAQGYSPEEVQQFLGGMHVKTAEQIAQEQAAQREFFANRPPVGGAPPAGGATPPPPELPPTPPASTAALTTPPAPRIPTDATPGTADPFNFLDAVQAERQAAINEFGTVGQQERWATEAAAQRANPPPPPRGWEPPPPPDRPVTSGLIQEPDSGPSIFDQVWKEVGGVFGAARTTLAGADLGVIARQLQPLGVANPAEYQRAASATVKAFANEDFARMANDLIRNSPDFEFADEMGFQMFDYGPDAVNRHPSWTGLNDSRVSRAINAAPGIKQGERSYSTGLNVLGWEVWQKNSKAMWNAGIRDEKAYRDLAEVINHARGYGTGSITSALTRTDAFFSARNFMAKFELITDPFLKSGSLTQPSARQLAAKSLLGLASSQVSLLSFLGITGALAGGAWSVDNNIWSGDWGKLKVGNTTIDTTGGFGNVMRTALRLGAMGADATLGTQLAPNNRSAVRELFRFFESKQSPVGALGTELYTEASTGKGRDFSGTPTQAGNPEWWANRLSRMYVPLIAQELYDGYKYQEGTVPGRIASTVAGAVLGGVGFGVSTYARPFEASNDALKADIETGVLPRTYKDAEGNEKPLTDLGQLTREQLNEFNKRYPDLAAQREEKANPAIQQLRSEQEVYNKVQEEQIDKLPFGPNWRDARSSNLQQKLGAIEAVKRQNQDYFDNLDKAEPVNLEDRVLKDYFDTLRESTSNGVVDWQQVDRVVAGWPPQVQDELVKSRLSVGSEKEREYLRDIARLEPFFEARDQQWQRMQASSPAFQKYETFDEFKQAKFNEGAKANPQVPEAILRQAIESALAPVEEAMSVAGKPILARDRELVQLLSKHGFYIPAEFRGLSLPAGQLVR